MEAHAADLRGYLGRILGWTDEERIAQAQEAVELAATHKTQLILCGAGDLVPVAFGLHRYAFGATPFIVCDPRRGDRAASVRSPANYTDVDAASAAARGGSLCVRRKRLPLDMPRLGRQLRATHDIQYILLESVATEWLVRPGPIEIPALATRVHEMPRIVDEYLIEARTELELAHPLDADEVDWLVRYAVRVSLGDLAKAARRLLVLRNSPTLTEAADRLEMAPVSLSRWMDRRTLPPTLAHAAMLQKVARFGATCALRARPAMVGVDDPSARTRRRPRRGGGTHARKTTTRPVHGLRRIPRARRSSGIARCRMRQSRLLWAAARAAAVAPRNLGR